MIRQEIWNGFNASLLYENPSIRKFAFIIEPLLDKNGTLSSTTMPRILVDDVDRQMPSLFVEGLSIILLVLQWILPLWLVYCIDSIMLCAVIPVFHMFSYLFYRYLMSYADKLGSSRDELYSWQYYICWFLKNLWSVNTSFWLNHLRGTSLYNYYLRLCGAEIGLNSHIYTTLIDASWLLTVGESSFVGEDVVLSNMSYQDKTYQLHKIQIGSYCSINIRCVLYEDVVLENYVHLKPMSVVTGTVNTPSDFRFIEDRSISFGQSIFQWSSIVGLLLLHLTLILLTKNVCIYFSNVSCLLSVKLAFSWLVWTLASFWTALILLKFVRGPSSCGHYSVNSYTYMKTLWLRQLILASFEYVFRLIPSYWVHSSCILRWLGVYVEEDVIVGSAYEILKFPPKLLKLGQSVTTFGFSKLAPFEMTNEGLCYIDEIHLGSKTNFGNWCTIMPGSRVSSETIVGSFTLITKETTVFQNQCILLGIPAHEMPFSISNHHLSSDEASTPVSTLTTDMLILLMTILISKCFFFTLYVSTTIPVALLIHVTVYCAIRRYADRLFKERSEFKFSDIVNHSQLFFEYLTCDFLVFLAPYLSGTQYLVFLFRVMGANIGIDVILPDLLSITDPCLVTIGNHVRLCSGACLMAHTFEQRVYKVAPIIIKDSSILMSHVLMQSGAILHGQNRILPWTLVIKEDQLPPNTIWSGVPAQQVI